MTGAGLVFVTVGSGGTSTSIISRLRDIGVVGGINVGPLTGGNINLSWVGNPAVNLQSTTILSPARLAGCAQYAGALFAAGAGHRTPEVPSGLLSTKIFNIQTF